jgi:hypothetical protein
MSGTQGVMKASKGVQQLLGAINGQTDRRMHEHTYTHSKFISCLLLIFKNMEVGQKENEKTHRYSIKNTYRISY